MPPPPPPPSTTLPLQQDFYKQLDFNDFGSQVNKDFVSAITAGLADHGMVVVDNIDLSEDQYLYLTASVGEPIDLPNFLVPAKLPGFPEIARVGNFGSDDGKVNPSYAFGFYWHHDGRQAFIGY